MSSIWTGVSGLLSYSQGIATTGNNLANVNTVGFKSARMLFADTMSAMAGGTSDGSQIGTGVQVGSTAMQTSVGSLNESSNATDMAIDGEHGYFVVKDTANDKTYCTRAGDFNFDKGGDLLTSTGLNVQGWAVDNDAILAAKRSNTILSQVPTTGDVTDIKITDFTIDPQATGTIEVVTNLDSQVTTGTLDSTDPYFTMFKSYDANSDTPVADSDYSATVKIYDSEGTGHTATVYYSKTNDESGKEYWEYMVTVPPSEDGSDVTGDTTKAGVLMIGTMTFSAQGVMENQTAFTPGGTDPTSLSSWTQASLTSSGVPEFSATFMSASNGTSLSAQSVAFKTGLSTTGGSWSATSAATAADIGTSTAANAGYDSSATSNAVSCTTNYATSSYTQATSQDGYAAGEMTATNVDEDGVLWGTFTNGQSKALYVVALASFVNPTDLRRDGNNLLSATTESGKATVARANTGVLDGISGSTLESSNVDMASEMVNLIVNQRAFQANSKVVTTAEDMMAKALEIKK
ncbi:flagellar hook-basal body complex protein [Desulfovibrio aerotolerans]|uniref:Flagellar hook protein FlgE n=1 Tax=Solidesulfovibrio aerotolerans TaxID=295255 RepID=A0A7C9IVQ3_9BACT|nr:flagellar hook-basal body complex protein [Solidesulfovibrio aerotolerans]MYL82902.1 flagellar hook-basal body complex protein [Solidesulfovibrio aerotolerans]